ncbi:MAG: UDP-N-acetylglucosamine--N-acetylmuramyl-(pentapeptide) pyrophosphoryl-undecaprenol N-acetylglucosamine transferase [Verrucomicrobia bacterium]|nr:UDP-N-acetylglucosamine--N-acetylmuramyl-(pentapeptide) pyrophosphoryl-undecaprenol N-acetylglucosamine transferase [Verrucomicrobiota bacterium]
MQRSPENPLVAIACGGTGGHLFPGLAVAEELQRHGCDALLLVSPKEVDQQAIRAARDLQVATLPAVALQGNLPAFARASLASYQAARQLFATRAPRAVLAMGGFTSAPPVWAGRKCGAKTFLHESNTIPGRANRWLAHFVDEAFVGFPQAAHRLWIQRHAITGTPVREQFARADAASCRMALGLDPNRPTLVITGGSQGATGLNDLVVAALPELIARHRDLQFIHLTGANDLERTRAAHEQLGIQNSKLKTRSLVQPFLTEMELALGAATLVVSRAGASSLAELAAMRAPAVLVPLPTAADNHQYFNARAFADTGAARLLSQRTTSPAQFAALISDLLTNAAARAQMQTALAQWHKPAAAADIAERILRACGLPVSLRADGEDAGWQPPARFAKRNPDPAGQDSVEPHFERSEAGAASISAATCPPRKLAALAPPSPANGVRRSLTLPAESIATP